MKKKGLSGGALSCERAKTQNWGIQEMETLCIQLHICNRHENIDTYIHSK